MSSLLPIFLDLKHRSVLVIGGRASAREKLVKLVPTGAQITVIARSIDDETRTLAAAHGMNVLQRPWQTSDLLGRQLVISAVDDAIEHARIAEQARAAGILLNAVDAPQSTDCYFGAQVQRGPLLVAISTQGLFPGLARAVRLWIDELLPTSLGQDIEELAKLRQSARQVLPDASSRMAALKDQLASWLAQSAKPTTNAHIKVS